MQYELMVEDENLIELMKDVHTKYASENLIALIPNKLAKKYNVYCSMRIDLKMIQEYLALLNSNSSIIQSALTYSVIALYGKCFTDASTDCNPKLDKKVYENNQDFLETHDFLMDLRHKFISHRGNTYNEVGIAYLLVPKNELFSEGSIEYMNSKRKGFIKLEIDKINLLIVFLSQWLESQTEKFQHRLREQFLKQFLPFKIEKVIINDLF